MLFKDLTNGDEKLDRPVQFDERSRSFSLRAAVGDKKPRSYTWRCNEHFDQGREGACVGFGLAHELAARPAEVKGLDKTFAKEVYWEAQRNDPWAGQSRKSVNYCHFELKTSVLIDALDTIPCVTP